MESQLIDGSDAFLGIGMSPIFKALLTIFCSLLIPITAIFFVKVRRTKKQTEFHRVVKILGIALDEAEFARNRVTEQYPGRDYIPPVISAWLLTGLGFFALFFGADMVTENKGKINFVLTALFDGEEADMQRLRLKSMVVLCWAFVGAFLWATLHIVRRLNAGDLAPSVYFGAATRFILAPTLSLAIAHLLEGGPTRMMDSLQGVLPALAFLIGIFPNEALIYLKQQVPVFDKSAKKSAHSLTLSMIEGVNVFDRARLSELDIDDAQNLATADFVEIMVRTPFSPGKVVDWIGQARLYLYFKDDIVRLRRCQVRNIFDLLTIDEDDGRLQALAEESKVSLSGLRLVYEKASADPKLRQLREFQNRLSHDLAGCSEDDSSRSTPRRADSVQLVESN